MVCSGSSWLYCLSPNNKSSSDGAADGEYKGCVLPEGGAFGWGSRKSSFVEGDSHRGIVFADGCSYSIAPQIAHGEEDMHGIARGHSVSAPLEYAFDHEVGSLPYVIS